LFITSFIGKLTVKSDSCQLTEKREEKKFNRNRRPGNS